MHEVDVLRAELEQGDLGELHALCRDALGLEPKTISEDDSLRAFAAALADYGVQTATVSAICDALGALRPRSSEAVRRLAQRGVGAAPLQELGPFRKLSALGEDAFGEVWLARGDHGDVRLRILAPNVASDPRLLARWQVRSRLCARAAHAGETWALELGDSAGRHWLSEPYLAGTPLSVRIARAPTPLTELSALLRALLEALSKLHRQRLPHGALTADSVWLPNATEPRVQLLDPGLDLLALPTRAGELTPALLSTLAPERLAGGEASLSADVYAVGALAYALLVGHTPCAVDDTLTTAYRRAHDAPPAPSKIAGLELPAELDRFVLQLLARDADARPRDASAALEALAALGSEASAPARPVQGREERVELLLARAEQAPSGSEKARLWREIAELYVSELDDREQALVAFTQALSETPEDPQLVQRIEQVAGNDVQLWLELLPNLASAGDELSSESRARLLRRVASWWLTQTPHSDRAEACWREALALAPADGAAFDGLSRLLRRAGRFRELADALLARADATANAPLSSELRAEAAALLADELADRPAAREQYQRVLSRDPTQAQARRGLSALLAAERDWKALRRLLEANLEELPAELRLSTRLELAALLEQKLDDRAEARRQYERALEAAPDNPLALRGLGRIYAAIGEHRLLLSNLNQQLKLDLTPREQVELLSELAKLHGEQFLDPRAERECLEQVLRLDPTRSAAWLRLASLCAGQLDDPARAREAYERALALEPDHPLALAAVSQDLLSRGDTRAALPLLEKRLAQAKDAAEAAPLASQLARLYRDAGESRRAEELARRALEIDPGSRAARQVLAELCASSGRAQEASEHYERLVAVSDLPPDRDTVCGYLDALSAIGAAERALPRADALLAAAGRDRAVVERIARLELEHGASRRAAELYAELLSAPQELEPTARASLLQLKAEAWLKAGERELGTRDLESALELSDDRRIMSRLMQLYAEAAEWSKLVAVVVRLAGFVSEPSQRAKYLHTAAMVSLRQLHDAERAAAFYEQVLAIEPEFDRALAEWIELELSRGEHAAAERLLRRRLELASSRADEAALVQSFDQLGELYAGPLAAPELAIDALEAAHTLAADDTRRAERLAALYGSDPERHLEKAVALQLAQIARTPADPAPYRRLRRLYTETQRADAAFCLCQALAVLGLAEADERAFYERFRSDSPAPVSAPVSAEDWLNLVMHPHCDSLLTSLFAVIEAAVIARRGQSAEALGYGTEQLLDLEHDALPMCQSLYYAAGVLGIALPPCYRNSQDRGGVSFLFAAQPSLVLGGAALAPDLPLQPAAFNAARSLSYLRPGMYLRQLLASGTALKAWLFAAIQLTAPQFPAPPELAGAVREAQQALDSGLQGPIRDHLTRVVAKLLALENELDLKRWVTTVDLTADRCGLLAADDLAAAVNTIASSDPNASALSIEQRVQELVLFAVSPAYLELRRKLGVTID